SVQRRHQKLVEIAPAPDLPDALREALHGAAVRLIGQVGCHGLSTVEFLVHGDGFVFLEVNPRIQVEHTVTEEVTGVDLVAAQIAIARGAGFDELGLPAGITFDGNGIDGCPAAAQGIAVRVRVNAETTRADGTALPAAGTLTTFTPPTGPGFRVDTRGRPGLGVTGRYDSLLAKVVAYVRSGDRAAVLRMASTALGEFVVDGV